MVRTPHTEDLALLENLHHERRTWRIERVAWTVMALLLLVAVGGVFGRGPLSEASARSDDGALVVEYERFLRQRAPADMKVQLPPVAGEVRVWLRQRYLDQLRVEHVVPEPSATELREGWTAWVFQAGAAPGAVAFRFEAEGLGRVRAELGCGADPPPAGHALTFSQFIYP